MAGKAKLEVWVSRDADLNRLRGRVAFWEKRVSLTRDGLRAEQLKLLAWAELTRLVLRASMDVYGRNHSQTVYERVVSRVLQSTTGLTRPKSSRSPARAASGRASSRTG